MQKRSSAFSIKLDARLRNGAGRTANEPCGERSRPDAGTTLSKQVVWTLWHVLQHCGTAYKTYTLSVGGPKASEPHNGAAAAAKLLKQGLLFHAQQMVRARAVRNAPTSHSPPGALGKFFDGSKLTMVSIVKQVVGEKDSMLSGAAFTMDRSSMLPGGASSMDHLGAPFYAMWRNGGCNRRCATYGSRSGHAHGGA